MEVTTFNPKETPTTSISGWSNNKNEERESLSGVNNVVTISVSVKMGELETDNNTFNKDFAHGLRNTSTILDKVAGTLFATPLPQTKGAALAIATLSLGTKLIAEYFNPSQPDDVVRGALVDVMTSDLIGSYYKDFAVDIGKAVMDHYSNE